MAVEMKEVIYDFASAMDYVENNWSRIYKGIGQCDQEIGDLEHEIELVNHTPYEAWQLYLKVKEVRLRRRALKDEQELLQPFKDWVDQHKGLSVDLFKITKKIKQVVGHHNNRHYVPRQRDDISLAERFKKDEKAS